jgi:hypothetical protein
MLMATLAALAPAMQPMPARAGSGNFTLARGRIVIDVLINGQGPYSMMLDSGAEAGAIAGAIAAALNLPAGPVFNTQFDQGFATVTATIGLGPDITLADVPLLRIDPAHDIGDPALAGLVPASLLTSANTLIDFDALTITRDANMQVPDGFAPLASDLSAPPPPRAARPYSHVTIGPNTLRLQWDTGAPVTMQIPRAAATALGLWDDTRPYAPERFGHIGGPDALVSRIVRAGPISLGPVSYDSALILLAGDTPEEAAFGLDLISTLNVFIDVAAQSLYVQRNSRPVPALAYDLSGLSLVQGQGQLVVADVGTGSPAAAAGVARGDLVLVPSTMAQAAALIDRPAGSLVTLTVQRGAGPLAISFILNPYL